MGLLVNSILPDGCQTCTLLADAEKRIQAFETKCLRKLLHVSHLEHKTNDWVLSKINCLVGPQEPLLAREMETCMGRACYMPWQPLPNQGIQEGE